jgi:hypothetical protein
MSAYGLVLTTIAILIVACRRLLRAKKDL